MVGEARVGVERAGRSEGVGRGEWVERADVAGVGVGGVEAVGARLAVVAAGDVKGLEYDHVVAVEPAAIVAAEERGLHRLYVVLTRAVSGLEVVHGRPLPF